MKNRVKNRFSNLLGMAWRGRNAVVGRDQVREAVHRRRAIHVFLAEDAGDALVDEMEALCRKAEVPLSRSGSRLELGATLGRAEVAVVALTDRGLAEAMLAEIEPPSEAAEARNR